MAALRAEFREEMHATAHELRDSDTFMGPLWIKGTDKVFDHILTKLGRKLLLYVFGAVTTVFLIWLGSTGVLFK